jgi:hypothetical protein
LSNVYLGLSAKRDPQKRPKKTQKGQKVTKKDQKEQKVTSKIPRDPSETLIY